MIKASVIGWPISHSRSPLIHGYWLKQHRINFIFSLRAGNHVGTNVTIPHKQTAMAWIDMPDERASRIGALNTIWRDGHKLHATSTDGPGFMANVQHCLPTFECAARPVTILGAGGSTRALVDELLRQRVTDIRIWNRTKSRAAVISGHFGAAVTPIDSVELERAFADTGLLINTTSAGMNGEGELELPWPKLHTKAVVADIVYTPLITPFLQKASTRGHAIVPGLGMLLHQAVVGFEKWFGVRPEVTDALYDLIARDIDPEYNR
jgi:shikimate dehydrogenase